MSLERFKTCLEKVPQNVFVHFAGMSEPWLNPECTKMVLYAHERGHRIRVYTTLAGMTLRDVEAIAEIPFEEFEVHLPSADGEEKITVDDAYLEVVKRLCASPIKARYHIHGTRIHPLVKPLVKKVEYWRLFDRAQNLGGEDKSVRRKRRRGKIGCRRLRYNILLPNGDVVICCMDYGMQHVIGNLLESDYSALFESAEFKRVLKGMHDESEEILCRYCDIFAYDADLYARIHNISFWWIPFLAKVRNRLKIFR